jgi:hypothetical protein
MFKLLPLVVGCLFASIGCDEKVGGQTAQPVVVAGEPTKASQTTPVKADTPATGGDGKWVTIKGKIIWNDGKGAAPKQVPIKPTKDEEVCAKDKDFNTEDWVVNAKTGGIKNVVVWVVPEPSDEAAIAALKKAQAENKSYAFKSFDPADIHPDLKAVPKNPIEIDQPCCRFIPHVLAGRAGQEMLIKNSASVPHNAKWVSRDNGEINPLIPAGGQFKLEKPLVSERFPIEVSCSIHPWMKAWVRVFDHPYFAITDENGNFEIKNAPVLKGKLRLFIWQENGMHGGTPGRFGQTIEVKPGTLDLKEIKFDTGK